MKTELKNISFEEAIPKVTAALADQGFGVLTTIDTRATFKKKLDVDTHPRVILGACNPHFAIKSLEIAPELSLLMPCNVVVEERDGRIHVSALDPKMMGQFSPEAMKNTEFAAILGEAGGKLQKALDSLSK